MNCLVRVLFSTRHWFQVQRFQPLKVLAKTYNLSLIFLIRKRTADRLNTVFPYSELRRLYLNCHQIAFLSEFRKVRLVPSGQIRFAVGLNIKIAICSLNLIIVCKLCAIVVFKVKVNPNIWPLCSEEFCFKANTARIFLLQISY